GARGIRSADARGLARAAAARGARAAARAWVRERVDREEPVRSEGRAARRRRRFPAVAGDELRRGGPKTVAAQLRRGEEGKRLVGQRVGECRATVIKLAVIACRRQGGVAQPRSTPYGT